MNSFQKIVKLGTSDVNGESLVLACSMDFNIVSLLAFVVLIMVKIAYAGHTSLVATQESLHFLLWLTVKLRGSLEMRRLLSLLRFAC